MTLSSKLPLKGSLISGLVIGSAGVIGAEDKNETFFGVSLDETANMDFTVDVGDGDASGLGGGLTVTISSGFDSLSFEVLFRCPSIARRIFGDE